MPSENLPRTYEEWLSTMDELTTTSPVWKLRVYRDALFLFDLAKQDCTKLTKGDLTRPLMGQLYRAVGSIGANIAEGCGRSSGKDRMRFFDYALGSAREADHWYHGCQHVLGDSVMLHRRTLINRICGQLVSLIPHQHNLRETPEDYTE